MNTHYLFAYGTLKSDQPEHAAHCSKPISITKARAPGTLWRLREGYPILQIDPKTSLLSATSSPEADWQEAIQLSKGSTPLTSCEHWIEGELFEYPLTSNVLDKMDQWENVSPGTNSPYRRHIIWVQDETEQARAAWAYVCYSPPNWATMLQEQSWHS